MEKLFTYGTLQIPDVQMAVFKRVTKGTPDVLEGYVKRGFTFDSGQRYPIIVEEEGESVSGEVIEVTPEELVLIDRYETSAYRRIEVTLKSGLIAWVYCK